MSASAGKRVKVSRPIGLLGIIPIAALAALSISAAVASQQASPSSVREAWRIGALTWAALAGSLTVPVVVGQISRVIVPPSGGLLTALALVCAGNLGLGVLAFALSESSVRGVVPHRDAEAVLFTFVTTALFYSGFTFSRRASPEGGVALMATALAAANANVGSMAAALLVVGILFPPIQ